MPPETTTQIDVSDIVLLTVKAALSPMLERIAAAEATIARATAHEPMLQDLRDRLAHLEIKAIGIGQIDPLRDRLIAMESKQGSVFVPTGPTEADLRTLADRLLVLETKGREMPAVAPSPSVEFLAIRDRVSALEARAAVPGPAGHDGKDGAPGRDGAPGADGLGYDDLVVVQTDRTFTIKALIPGGREKVIGTVSFPVMEQKGIYQDGKAYEPGDVVTWSGSQWHCGEATSSKPGNGAKAWTLIVKCGRDGKDGRDAPSIPVVQMGGGRG